MNGQVTWLLEASVKPGELENLRTVLHEMVESTRAEPGSLSYEWSIDDAGGVCHGYERFADSAADVAHLASFLENFAERFLAAVSPTRLFVYGSPGDDVKEALSGFSPVVMAHLDGFTHK